MNNQCGCGQPSTSNSNCGCGQPPQSTTYTAWYNNGSGYYEFAGQYQAASSTEARKLAKSDGLGWTDDIVISDTDPN